MIVIVGVIVPHRRGLWAWAPYVDIRAWTWSSPSPSAWASLASALAEVGARHVGMGAAQHGRRRSRDF